jgi:hypothetical protein
MHEVLEGRANKMFLERTDTILNEWAVGKLTAVQACEKVRKAVSLFISEDLAKDIGNRCAPIVMKESAANK